jgi:hypothetical protein
MRIRSESSLICMTRKVAGFFDEAARLTGDQEAAQPTCRCVGTGNAVSRRSRQDSTEKEIFSAMCADRVGSHPLLGRSANARMNEIGSRTTAWMAKARLTWRQIADSGGAAMNAPMTRAEAIATNGAGTVLPNIDEARSFLTALEEEAESFCFQTFDDQKDRKDPALARVMNGTLDAALRRTRRTSTAAAPAIFVTVNDTDGKGRKLDNMAQPPRHLPGGRPPEHTTAPRSTRTSRSSRRPASSTATG